MAIGTALALGIGAAASLGGAALSSSAQKKAANTAAGVAQDTAAQNNAMTREIYGQNLQNLTPFMQRGNMAGSYLNAMLGLPANDMGTAQIGTPTAQPLQSASYDAYGMGGMVNDLMYNPMQAGVAYSQPGGMQVYPTMGGMTGGNVTTTVPRGVTQQQAQDAFGNYIKNSDYGFQLATGANNLNSGYAGAGTLQSGAAMKALEKFRQNLQSGYRTEYMGALANQQGVGLSGANALAGVGTNMVNTISNNNNNAGTAAANAALAAGNGGFGNALSGVGGALLGYGMR